ncbi:hypothetical protein CGRA01v4_05339 [Colletotrichum graminicola]|nr:hypothetical protein CGRA01v4_05339 [Colletotrichum graminicola]
MPAWLSGVCAVRVCPSLAAADETPGYPPIPSHPHPSHPAQYFPLPDPNPTWRFRRPICHLLNLFSRARFHLHDKLNFCSPSSRN